MTFSAAVLLLAGLQGTTVTVEPGGTYSTITAGISAARPGDTVLVRRGHYRERPVIAVPVVLLGEPGAVIDGGGDGIVLTVTAPATIAGFTIRGSGARQVEEHAGILADRADGLVVEDNVFEDVLFGVYIKQSNAPVIRRNRITGKDIPSALRGDGIRLWYSHHGVIDGNDVRRARDVVIWFSDSTSVTGNRVADSRYGLHYMYSNHNRFEQNEFVHNSVGAFLMYSSHIVFRDNVFADARGTAGRGLGFKDTDHVLAERNTLVRNAIGITIDNSPSSTGVTNRFVNNIIAFNDVGISLLPSVHSNHFGGNAFVDNVQAISVTGAGTATANRWWGNYWSEYAGFDGDADGHGDTPFVYERLSDDVFAKHDALRMFNLSLATSALDMLSRVFPLLQPAAIVVDSLPRLARSEVTAPVGRFAPRITVLLGFLVLGVTSAGVAVGLRRPRRPRAGS